jgi:hypothetical protein
LDRLISGVWLALILGSSTIAYSQPSVGTIVSISAPYECEARGTIVFTLTPYHGEPRPALERSNIFSDLEARIGLVGTTNGGSTWSGLHPPDGLREVFGGITDPESIHSFFLSPLIEWTNLFGHNYGGTWQTNDGGITWKCLLRHPLLSGPVFLNRMQGWMSTIGRDNLSNITYWKTNNGGDQWIACGTGINFTVYHPFFLDSTLGWASYTVGREKAGIASTHDGGCSWKSIWTNENEPDFQLGQLTFGSESHGWVAWNGALSSTEDGGRTWRRVNLPVEGFRPMSAYRDKGLSGWLLGYDPKGHPGLFMMYRTSDGAKSWHRVSADELAQSELPFKWHIGRIVKHMFKHRM